MKRIPFPSPPQRKTCKFAGKPLKDHPPNGGKAAPVRGVGVVVVPDLVDDEVEEPLAGHAGRRARGRFRKRDAKNKGLQGGSIEGDAPAMWMWVSTLCVWWPPGAHVDPKRPNDRNREAKCKCFEGV